MQTKSGYKLPKATVKRIMAMKREKLAKEQEAYRRFLERSKESKLAVKYALHHPR